MIDSQAIFENIRVVLVEPSHPGNIGAVARAMKTQFLQSLWLVRPRRFPAAEATMRASGADDLLEQANVVGRLEDALADCRLVVGASARRREMAVPDVSPRDGAALLAAEAAGGPVALVLGRESAGLTNQELGHCHHVAHIPANPTYASLNLAAAAQVFSYEIHLAVNALADAAPDLSAFDEPATGADMRRFYAHLEEQLVAIGFLNPDAPKKLMPRLRRLFNRARLEKSEVQILRGILTAVEKRSGER